MISRDRKRFNVSLRPDQVDQLDVLCGELGKHRSHVIEVALYEFLRASDVTSMAWDEWFEVLRQRMVRERGE